MTSPRTIALALLLLLVPAAAAQENASPPNDDAPQRRLVVATKVAEPFAMRNEAGEWTGIAIELWRRIADDIDVTFDLVEHDLEGMIDAVAAGEADAGVAAVTVTAEREQRLDFTHPFFHAGLGIAVVPERGGAWVTALRRLFSAEFFQAILALAALLLGVGLLVWLFERRRNAEEFGGAVRGLGSGFWWSAVTMTTVGYGDKAPRTLGGRLVALVWMFASIIIISGFTAAIASALTVSSLDSVVAGPEDLVRVRVGTVADSAPERVLRADGIRLNTYESVADALDGLRAGDVRAVVYDAPILKYNVSRAETDDVAVLPVEFEQQDYAIILPEGSPLREDINTALLARVSTDEWTALVNRYLGR